MKVHFLQHVSFEGPAALLDWFQERGHATSVTRVYAEPIGMTPTDLDVLVVMGGPMSVHDVAALPWLAGEKEFIRDCIAAKKRVLGICLGAQLLGENLGGVVTKNPAKEIGFYPVQSVGEIGENFFGAGEFTAYHWHGETFSMPPGAVHLASSKACSHQAFLWQEHVLGLQFHLEMTAASMAELIQACRHELVPGPTVQTVEEMVRCADFTALSHTLDRLLSHWLTQYNCNTNG